MHPEGLAPDRPELALNIASISARIGATSGPCGHGPSRYLVGVMSSEGDLVATFNDPAR
jgi:hypothetical protein